MKMLRLSKRSSLGYGIIFKQKKYKKKKFNNNEKLKIT